MIHEKTIKDERGKVVVTVTLWVENMPWNANAHRWTTYVEHTLPGKRKAERNEGIATPEEILAAKMELWNKIKPS